SHLARLRSHMQFAFEHNHNAYSNRSQELGYLANTLVAGCSIQARSFTPKEASEAVAAVCNLGLENWQSGADAGTLLTNDFLIAHDLISVFQAGWTALHERVCMYTAERLIATLAGLQSGDSETLAGLDILRREMTRHWQAGEPWRGRDDLDVLAIL